MKNEFQLTIDTGHLGDLWLPSEKREREAMEYFEATLLIDCHGVAWSAVRGVWRSTVDAILARGGLLLIVGA